jgi:hypothetical protein
MNRLLLISLLLSSGCYADAIRGSGKSAKESRDLPAFDSVEVGSGIHLTVTTGPLQKVLVEADDNVLPLVETRVSDGRLQIGFRRHNLWNSGDVNVTVRSRRAAARASTRCWPRRPRSRWRRAAEAPSSRGGWRSSR